MAPEVLRGRKHTKASDVYGFGMVMYELLTGKPPFFGELQDWSLITAIIEGSRPHVPRYTPQFYRELMEQCWDSEPSKRPTSDEIFDKLRDLDPFVVYNKDKYMIMPQISEEQEKQWREQVLDSDTTASLQQMSLCSTLLPINSSLEQNKEYPSNKFDISMLC